MSEFNLKSGNTTPFKMMASSPAKQTEPKKHEMTGTINDAGTRVVNEQGKWEGVADRPDLATPKQVKEQKVWYRKQSPNVEL